MMCSVFDYTASLADSGMPVFPQVDCELTISTEVASGDFDMSVTAVVVNDVDLLQSHDFAFKRLGMMIAEQAEMDDDLINLVMAAENVAYEGEGGNDPDGRFVRRAA
jgi:hypothetical protein